MNKIFKFITILFFMMIFAVAANAKLNLFPQARYIPELSFYDDNGKEYQLKDFEADLLLAVLWSKTCGPCIKDMKSLNSFAQEVKNKGVQVILISPAEEWKSNQERHEFLSRIGAPDLVSYNDKKATFMKGMGIFVTPTTILVTKNHLEAGQITGTVKWDNPDVIQYILKLKAKILQKLNEGKAANQ